MNGFKFYGNFQEENIKSDIKNAIKNVIYNIKIKLIIFTEYHFRTVALKIN